MAAPRRPAFSIGGHEVAPGRKARLELPVATLPTGSSFSLPVSVVHGSRPGPTVWLSGAIHGDELNGVEIIRLVLRELRASSLAGTVIAAPVVNVFGFITESRYLPDRRDLNRSFPGARRGSMASRLAHLFMTEVVDRCDVGIDLHTGSHHRSNLPQIRCATDDPTTMALAEAFAAPVTVHSALRDGSLRAACVKRDIPILLYEAGEAHRFDDFAIAEGVAGVLRVLAHLEMRPVGDDAPAGRTQLVDTTSWVRAGRSGLFRLSTALGARVAQGEELGAVADAHGQSRGTVRAPFDGVVIGMTQNPQVSQGDALVHVADVGPDRPRRRGVARDPRR
ncbi:MAG: succinylglutamate desuccinylase/aspartoacylase family protein [Iamia sp.]